MPSGRGQKIIIAWVKKKVQKNGERSLFKLSADDSNSGDFTSVPCTKHVYIL